MQIPQIPRFFRVIGGLMVVLSVLAGTMVWWLGQPLVPAAGPNQDPQAIALELVVPKGSSAQGVGLVVEDAGLPVSATAFASVVPFNNGNAINHFLLIQRRYIIWGERRRLICIVMSIVQALTSPLYACTNSVAQIWPARSLVDTPAGKRTSSCRPL